MMSLIVICCGGLDGMKFSVPFLIVFRSSWLFWKRASGISRDRFTAHKIPINLSDWLTRQKRPSSKTRPLFSGNWNKKFSRILLFSTPSCLFNLALINWNKSFLGPHWWWNKVSTGRSEGGDPRGIHLGWRGVPHWQRILTQPRLHHRKGHDTTSVSTTTTTTTWERFLRSAKMNEFWCALF